MNSRTENKNALSIYSLSNNLSAKKILPIYFFFGVDMYAIDEVVKTLESVVSPLITSDFDKDIIRVEKKQRISEILDMAYAFPFGSGRKLMIVKNFENISDKKEFLSYVENPSETTILVLIQKGKITNLKSVPYNLLAERKYLFEAKELKGTDLIKWAISKANKLDIKLSSENAYALVEIVGEDKSLLEMHLNKFINYLGKNKELTFETIKKLSSLTKEYNIFNLQDALGRGEEAKALQIVFNLLNTGQNLTMIISMLTKFISVIAQSIELDMRKIPDNNAAKAIEVSVYYYRKCKNAKFFRAENRLFKAAEALFNADLTLKTTSADNKTIGAKLISEMMN